MRTQQGMTLVGMLLAVVFVVMAAIVVMRVIPVYIENYSIVQSVKALSSTPADSLTGDPMADVQYLRNTLEKRLDINGVSDLKQDQVTIVQEAGNKFTVKLKYEAVRSLVFNVSLLFNFEETIKVVIGSEN